MNQLLLDYVWSSERCDDALYNEGVVIIVACMTNSKCGDMLKMMSHKSGIKFDFHNIAGRNAILCHANDLHRAYEFINTIDLDKLIRQYH